MSEPTDPTDADRDTPDDDVLSHVQYVPVRGARSPARPGPDDPTEEMPALWRPADEPWHDDRP